MEQSQKHMVETVDGMLAVYSSGHLTPPRLISRQCSLTEMLGEVFVSDKEGSMRRRSRGCRWFALSTSLLFTYILRVLPVLDSLRTCVEWGRRETEVDDQGTPA